MSRQMRSMILALSVGASLLGWRATVAQNGSSGGQAPASAPATRPHWQARAPGAPVTLLVSASRLERPAMEYALLPKAQETEKGNAAVKYLEAAEFVAQASNEDINYLTDAATLAPLADLRENDPALSAVRQKFRMAVKIAMQGARLESADWETNVRREGIAALLPTLGRNRTLAAALALEARFDIQRHDWPAAREKMMSGYALAQHLGQGETIIESLVGIAIAATMNRCVEDWVAQPGSPNLYWPLSNLPAPFNTLRRAMWTEQGFAFFTIPEMKEIKAGHYSRERWVAIVARVTEMGGLTGSGGEGPLIGGTNLPLWKQEMAAAALGMALYPEAKRFLQAGGMTLPAVEAMPTYEALERYFVRSFEEESDETFKWVGLPPREMVIGLREAGTETATRAAAGETNLLAQILLPSLGRVGLQANRVDRQIAMLRLVEALRAYAAEKGAFPADLKELEVPMPMDPLSGAAFGYEVQGETASIISNANEPRDRMRYDLTLRK